MRKRILIFILFFVTLCPAMAAERKTNDRFINKSLYKNIYPSTLNGDVQNAALDAQGGKNTIKNTTPVTSSNRRVVKRPTRARTANKPQTTSNTPKARGVVPRGGANTARAAATTSANVRPTKTTNTNNNSNRRVVTRNTNTNNRVRLGTGTTKSSIKMSSQQCFANYKECMDGYCERNDTAYNRCYCSAKLAQIDSKYQNKIDSLIQQIIKLKYNADANDTEIKEYWDTTIGTYTNTNPWTNIDNALNIDWASTESRVRGQNAFATGHSYCVQNLQACAYMATNLRDAYKSEIERDCATYEKGLSRIQMAAESVIERYNK